MMTDLVLVWMMKRNMWKIYGLPTDKKNKKVPVLSDSIVKHVKGRKLAKTTQNKKIIQKVSLE